MTVSQKENSMTKSLGMMLNDTINELESARIKMQNIADIENLRIEKENKKSLVDNIRHTIIRDIESGEVPVIKVTERNDASWIRRAFDAGDIADMVPHQHVWYTFVNWATNNDLIIDVTYHYQNDRKHATQVTVAPKIEMWG